MFSNCLNRLILAVVLLAPFAASAEKFYTYVGDAGPTHLVLAWGTATGNNTIGRSSRPHGKVTIRINGGELTVADRNWAMIRGLQPDTEYPYEVLLNGAKIASAKVRTWPEKSDKLRFFVIGDFGTGDTRQRRVAEAMWKEFQRLSGDNPVRFVITTGDNIYGHFGFTLRFSKTGDEDNEWGRKFFGPYEPVLARIPFYASLGNHDGNETEQRADIQAYLDNFFFPGVPENGARYYRFSYGGLADFFSIDTTTNAEQGPPRPIYGKDSDQFKWFVKNIEESKVPWKIPFMHHPPYNAGPRHPAVRNELSHFIEHFRKRGVRVVFNGHEHNFQYSFANEETGGIRYVTSGAGGELRDGDVRASMRRAHIEGWAPQPHFMSVEIEGKEMRMTPISYEPFDVVDADGKKLGMPIRVTLP